MHCCDAVRIGLRQLRVGNGRSGSTWTRTDVTEAFDRHEPTRLGKHVGASGMSFTLVGLGVMVAGAWLFVTNKRGLALMTVFSIPFTATAVANVNVSGGRTGVSVYVFLASLFVIRQAIDAMAKRKVVKLGPAVVLAWASFALVIMASILVPLLLHHSALLVRHESLSGPYVPASARFEHEVTQVGYVFVGIAFMLALAMWVRANGKLLMVLRSYVLGTTFASIWGLYQLASRVGHIPYLTLFNNDANPAARGYEQTLGGLPRVASVALEPSILAQTLLISIALLLVAAITKRRLFSGKMDGALLSLHVAALVVTTSSSGYAGLTLLLVLAIPVLLRNLRASIVMAGTIAIAVSITALVVFGSTHTGELLIRETLTQKLHSYSAVDRLHTVLAAWKAFTWSPILGMGWGTVTSHDVFVRVLANAGVLGLMTFLLATFSSIAGLFQVKGGASARARRTGLLLATLTVGSVMVVTGLEYPLGYMWLLLAIGIAERGVASSRQSPA